MMQGRRIFEWFNIQEEQQQLPVCTACTKLFLVAHCESTDACARSNFHVEHTHTETTMPPVRSSRALSYTYKPLKHAWEHVAREAVGPEGQVVPQQWLARTSAPDIDPADRRRLDFAGLPRSGGLVLRCQARVPADTGWVPSTASPDGAVIAVAERIKGAACPEVLRPGPQRLCVLACSLHASPPRCNSCGFEPNALLPPCAASLARAGCAMLRRCRCLPNVALQSTLAATLLGTPCEPCLILSSLEDALHDVAPHPKPPASVVCTCTGTRTFLHSRKRRMRKK